MFYGHRGFSCLPPPLCLFFREGTELHFVLYVCNLLISQCLPAILIFPMCCPIYIGLCEVWSHDSLFSKNAVGISYSFSSSNSNDWYLFQFGLEGIFYWYITWSLLLVLYFLYSWWSDISLWWPLSLNISIQPNLRTFHPFQDISLPSKDLIARDRPRCK